MPTNKKFPVTELDFDQIKTGLKEYLKGQDQFKDYNFEGSNMSVLLDILSYNTFQNNFYTNMAISEMFLDSAQLRDSIVSHAKELNYLPKSKTSAKAIIDLTLNTFGNPSFVTVPAKTKFNAVCGNDTYTFYTERSETIFPSNGVYAFRNLEIFEGEYVTEQFQPSLSPSNRYLLSNEDIDVNSIRVRIIENDFIEEYVYAPDLYSLSELSKVFFIQPYVGNRYEIFFGRDVFGIEPPVGSIIEVEYRITAGAEANGITSYEVDSNIQGFQAIATLKVPSRGGSDREDLNSIKYFAPKSIQVQERAITVKDYEILLKRNFPEIKTVAVYGGETLTPPQYGRVLTSVALQDFSTISFDKREEYRKYLKERCSLTVEPIVVPAEFAYYNINTRVNYNVTNTDKSKSDIRKAVQEAILEYSNDNLGDFKRTLRFSKLKTAIDDADENIVSNETDVNLIIEIQPVPGFAENFVLEFENRLFVQKDLARLSESIDTVDTAIISTAFTYKNRTAFLRDNGLGTLEIITRFGSEVVVLERNVGTVDYQTGLVRLNNFEVQSYIGSAVKIFAKTFARDIVSPKERVSLIRDQDIQISITGISE
jgi:hypothetical protein